MKPINLIQKYSEIIELYAGFLKIFATTIDLSISFLISFNIYSTPKI